MHITIIDILQNKITLWYDNNALVKDIINDKRIDFQKDRAYINLFIKKFAIYVPLAPNNKLDFYNIEQGTPIFVDCKEIRLQ